MFQDLTLGNAHVNPTSSTSEICAVILLVLHYC